MIRSIHIWLWGMIAELEHILYPWKSSTPPSWAAERYGVDANTLYDDPNFDNDLHFDWLKSHDEKLNKLEENMILAFDEIHKLKTELISNV